MANLSEDIQCAGLDTRPPMLDRTDFASWQQRIRLYCRGKDNGVNILKSIDEGPYKMGTFRETLAESTEGTPQNQATVQDGRVVVQNVQGRPNRGQGMNPQGESAAGYGEAQNKVGNVNQGQARPGQARTHYSPSSSASSSTQVPPPLANSSSPAEDLIENLTNTLALLTQSYRTFLPQTNNQLQTSSNARNQATVQDGRVVVQNVQGRPNRGQGMNPQGESAAGYGEAQNKVGNVNQGQARPGQARTDLALNVDNVFQAEDYDAFDSDVDEAPTTQDMFMANLSSVDLITNEAGPSYDSVILSEVQDHDQYLDAPCAHHEEHVMYDGVQLDHVVDLHADYTSVSNMIPYDQYVKDNEVPAVHSDASCIPNDAFMMIYNDMCEPSAPSVSNMSRNAVVKNSLTAELATYRGQVELYEQRAKFESTEREQKINEQLRLVISDRNFKEETLKRKLHSTKLQLASTINRNKSMVEETTFLKQDFKQKENKYLADFLNTKSLKEKVKDKLVKQDQSLQTVHMLCRPRPLYNELNKVAIGYKNPLCLTRAKQAQLALYNGYEILKDNHALAKVHNAEDTLEIAEITKKKMNAKMTDPECVTRKVKISPHDYSKENFLATFIPQKQLTPEQIYWSNDLMKLKSKALKEQTKVSRPNKAFTVYPPNTPVKLVPRVLPTKSQVKIHIFTLIQLFLDFDKTCEKRITPTGLTEGERGFEQTKGCYLKEVIPFFKTLKDNFEGIQKALTKEIKEMKYVFEEMEAEVAQLAIDRKHDAIDRKNLLIANDNLIAECLSQEVFSVVKNFELNVARFTKMHVANTSVEARCLALEAELANLLDKNHHENQEELINHFFKLEVNHLNLQLKYQNLKDNIRNNPPTPDKETPDFDSVFVIGKMQASLQGKDNAIRQLKKQLSQLQVARSDTERTNKVRTTDSPITKLTDQVTNLQAQNDLFRAENAKIKQHYKELNDSIKITRAKHIEQVTKLTTKNVTLKANVSKARVQPQVLTRAKHALDVEPIVPRLRNNKDAHLDYLRHLKESVETIRDIVEEAKGVRPLDRSIVSACRYTKYSQELLEYAIGTCPQGTQQRAKQLTHTPLIRKKQVTISKPSDRQDSNKHPKRNPKTNRIMPARGANKLPVGDQHRTNKSHLRTTNHVDSSSRLKRTVINSNSDSICRTCNRCLTYFDHDMCVATYLKSAVAPHSTRHNCKDVRKLKQVWKPKQIIQVRKPTGKVLTTIGHQWRPTGWILNLGKQCPLTRCQLDEQWFVLTKDTLREALQITPFNNNQAFVAPPSAEKEFTQSIYTFMEDKRNLSRHTTRKKRAILILIPSICFTKLIIHHLQRRHKFHPRPDSSLHLSNDEPVLGYLKFSAKGTKREVFGMPIPSSLITADIREAPYYQEYQANVAKHRGFLAGETGSAQDSPAPKPAKPARKPKSTAQKAPPMPSVSTMVASAQPTPTSAPSKPQENKHKQATETTNKPAKARRIKHSAAYKLRNEDVDYQKAVEESVKTAYALPRGPLPPVVIRKSESGKYQPLPEVPGKGKAKVTEEQVAHDLLSLQKAKKKSPMKQYIFQRRIFEPAGSSLHDESLYVVLGQSDNEEKSKKVVLGATGGGQAGSNPDEMSEGQAGPDPSNDGNEDRSIPSPVVHAGSDREHMDLDATDVSPQPSTEQLDEGFLATAYPKIQESLKLAVEEQVLLEEPASSSGTLSSLHHLSRDISFGDQFFSDKPSEADKNTETKVESMVNFLIQQALSSITASLIIDLTSRPVSPKVHQQFKATTTDTTTTTTTTTVPPPIAQQQSSTEAMMIKHIGELKHIMADLLKVNNEMEARLDKHGACLYMQEQLDIPQQVCKAVSEVVTEAVDWAMQAPLRNRFRDLPEADMKEILHHRMWESESYKSYEDHMQLFEALKKSMNRDHSEELTQDLAKARKKKKNSRESPKTPPGSPPHQPPPPPPLAGPSEATGAPGASGSSQSPPPHPPPSTSQESPSKGSAAPSPSKTATSAEYQAWTMPDVTLRSSAYFPKVNLRQDRWKPLEEERIATPEPAWSISSSDAPVLQNNWESALASDYLPPPEDSLFAQTGDMATFIDWFSQRRGITELKPQDLEGPAFEIVKVFHPDVIHLQYQMEECHKLLTDSVDDYIPRNNVSKPLPLGGPPGQMKAAYYPDTGLEQMVPDQLWIDEECKYDIAAMYSISHWWFQRQLFYIDRHTSEGDRNAVRTHMQILSVARIEVFSMYGYDYMKKIVFRRANLNEHVIAERDFKYLYPSDFEDLQLVIRQRVQDFQLGIESYQTQLNLTKPQWDATGFEYKHDYTVIDSPRAVIFQDKYGVQMMMRFNEIHKFSDEHCSKSTRHWITGLRSSESTG
uniref:Integrase, catalytic region, zinc finger, CCHC-type, peptidase aspartic, catalytic n=1 Tax=Tanacetum cinerariifolium TaxID=118510 RepID=A0A6L2MYF0_TANCI|nr:integrase, catalytic region, zinc finger, CCHC-type, peptidase aspartic, catalytic [Tanacetum cinerariifolium]